MVYLSASDFESYGVDLATPLALIGAVSALVDAHCKRPTLAPAQYTERLRLMPDTSTVRLTFLPLAVISPATSPIVSGAGALRPAQARRSAILLGAATTVCRRNRGNLWIAGTVDDGHGGPDRLRCFYRRSIAAARAVVHAVQRS